MIPSRNRPEESWKIKTKHPSSGCRRYCQTINTNKTMFKTIYSVEYAKQNNDIFTTYFEDYDDALAFTEDKKKELGHDFCSYHKSVAIDGSFCESWFTYDDSHHFRITDDAWLTDWPNGLTFHTERGLPIEFENLDAFREYIHNTQITAMV